MDLRKRRLLMVTGIMMAVALALGWLAVHFQTAEQMKHWLNVVRTSGAPIFFVAMALLPLVGVPIAPFIFSAGSLFGPTLGLPAVILYAITAVTINVSLAYWVAARALRPALERIICWLGYTVPDLQRANSWEFTLLLRVVPGVPFFLQSYLLGLARVRLGIYLGFSILIPSGYICAATIAGDALMQKDRGQLLAAGIIFAVVGLVLHRTRKRLVRHRRSAIPEDLNRNSTEK